MSPEILAKNQKEKNVWHGSGLIYGFQKKIRNTTKQRGFWPSCRRSCLDSLNGAVKVRAAYFKSNMLNN